MCAEMQIRLYAMLPFNLSHINGHWHSSTISVQFQNIKFHAYPFTRSPFFMRVLAQRQTDGHSDNMSTASMQSGTEFNLSRLNLKVQ